MSPFSTSSRSKKSSRSHCNTHGGGQGGSDRTATLTDTKERKLPQRPPGAHAGVSKELSTAARKGGVKEPRPRRWGNNRTAEGYGAWLPPAPTPPPPLGSPPLAECLPEAPRFLGSAAAAAEPAPESRSSTRRAAHAGVFEPALFLGHVVLGGRGMGCGLQLWEEKKAQL